MNGFKVKVQTSDVIKKLLENKQQHIEQYEEAKDSYLKKCQKQAHALIDRCQLAIDGAMDKAVEHSKFFEKIYAPTLHEDEYERALGIMRLHVDQTIELDMDTYKKFYQNDWSWRHSFDSIYSSNTGKRAK